MTRDEIEQRIASGSPGRQQVLPSLPVGHRFVALGGGSGLPIVLRGLKDALFPAGSRWVEARDRSRLTGIVTVADDGGSSGRLRRAYGVLPPGDIRNCLLALADGDPTLAALFGYRFNGDGGLGGHSLGNLILTALNELERDFSRAVNRAGRILAVRGRVLPATAQDVSLHALLADGGHVSGESRIGVPGRPIRRVALIPSSASVFPVAAEAAENADLVTIGPGSVYTSLLPVLLVRGLAEAVAGSSARVVLIMNLMTEPGETDGYSAADVLRALRLHVPRMPIHDVLLNTAAIPAAALRRYAERQSTPIVPDPTPIRALGCRPVLRDLLGTGPTLRHDPGKLARSLLGLAAERRA